MARKVEQGYPTNSGPNGQHWTKTVSNCSVEADINHGYAICAVDQNGYSLTDKGALDWLHIEDRRALIERVRAESACSFGLAQHPQFGLTILAIATPEIASSWHGSTSCAAGASGWLQKYVICFRDSAILDRQFENFADAFGWSPAVLRAVHALYLLGDVKQAARHCGLSFHTTREYLKLAREAIGVANLPLLIMLLGVSSTGLASAGGESGQLLFELFDLTERQSRVADMVANGLPRSEAACQLGISEALVKKEMTVVFGATGATSAIALARIVSEARAMAIFTNYCDNVSHFPAPHRQTLRIFDGERQIVANDYGPRNGRPVLVMHSSMTGRAVNRQLVEELQNAGFRPVSLDRPGFGDTDPAVKNPGEASDPFRAAAQDVIRFCEFLQEPRIDIVTRGAAQVVLALHDVAPGLIRRAIIINPDPDTASSSKREGRMGAVKHSFVKRPWAVAAMARFIAVLSTYDRSRESMMKAVANCPPDRQVMADPANLADYYRGIEPYHQGKIEGFIEEQVALATSGKPPPRGGTTNFHLMLGESDFVHDPLEVATYWKDVLPDARIDLVKSAGRFLAFSHARHVVDALVE